MKFRMKKVQSGPNKNAAPPYAPTPLGFSSAAESSKLKLAGAATLQRDREANQSELGQAPKKQHTSGQVAGDWTSGSVP